MHVQKLSIIKWIFSISQEKAMKVLDCQANNNELKMQDSSNSRDKNLTEAQYFRLKENSKFVAKGI